MVDLTLVGLGMDNEQSSCTDICIVGLHHRRAQYLQTPPEPQPLRGVSVARQITVQTPQDTPP